MAKNDVTGMFYRARQILQAKINEMPEIVGNAIVNYSLDAFKKESWDGVPWKKRKRPKKGDPKLLIKSGILRGSIRVIRTTPSSVVVGSSVRYAQVHNDGLTINRTARSETFRRPRYKIGAKGKMFGGMGAYRAMTSEEKKSAPTMGQTYRAYSFQMPQRRFLGVTQELKKKINAICKEESRKAIDEIGRLSRR